MFAYKINVHYQLLRVKKANSILGRIMKEYFLQQGRRLIVLYFSLISSMYTVMITAIQDAMSEEGYSQIIDEGPVSRKLQI